MEISTNTAGIDPENNKVMDANHKRTITQTSGVCLSGATKMPEFTMLYFQMFGCSCQVSVSRQV